MTALTAEQQAEVAERMPMLETIAAKAATRFQGRVSFGEALSSACLGACQATSGYKPEKGASLSTAIWRRASGQIIDDARKNSGFNRRTHEVNMRTRAVDWGSVEGREADHLNTPNGRSPLLSALGRMDEGFRDVDDRDEAEALIRDLTDNEQWREVLRLRYVENLTARDTAERLGISESLVFWIVRNIRKANAG